MTDFDNQLISLHVNSDNGQKYKSIGSVVWNQIPLFSVLTGLNGSGKTQLLEVIAHKITKYTRQPYHDIERLNVHFVDEKFEPHDVVYIPASLSYDAQSPSSIMQLKQQQQQLFHELKSSQWTQQPQNTRLRVQHTRLLKHFNIPDFNNLTIEQFEKDLPKDFSFMLDDSNVVTGLSHVFMAYKLRKIELLASDPPDFDAVQRLPPPPWEVVNEALAIAHFPYKVVSIAERSVLADYELKLRDNVTGNEVSPNDLSSGEKVILQTILWLYNSQNHNQFPRLLILDEPDAHLHPSMTQQFLDVMNEVLVKRYKVRVIMTTHSPSTVALAPEGSVFEMPRTETRTIKARSNAEMIGLLTAGLVIVSRSTKYIFVEDDADVDFYGAVRTILTDYGPRKDVKSLHSSTSLVFLPASVGSGPTKVSGGKSVVVSWIDKFDLPPLNQIFHGIVDLDSDSLSIDRIKVIGRYSIENYLLDPLLIFALLINNGTAPDIDGISISTGSEHLIQNLSEDELQKIVLVISARVEKQYPIIAIPFCSECKVTFTCGKSVKYPGWMIYHQGHRLLPKYQAVFGDQKSISPPKLLNILLRVRLLPVELADIMTNIQG